MKTKFKLCEGEKLNRNPHKPVIDIRNGYLWIGNDAPDDMVCFATLAGKKTLLKLAEAIKQNAK